ncbi:hypothetical protein OPV22_015210 [Ensete ventricosum]|uniref:STAR protein homodimerisation region domain-containing protein n=1 Tax=Ensete ventricosum TaxID=4639 RepID=A0AAV8PS58_ENSVE|nr:hypothetical protein OPV22_015210 [Ensete ventricosum]
MKGSHLLFTCSIPLVVFTHLPPLTTPMRSLATSDGERYLDGLLAERQKLGPFLQVLPFCYRLLNQEIVQASGLAANRTFVDHERIEHVTPLRSTRHPSNGGPMDLE